MPRYAFKIEYNGNGFAGWQRQKDHITVQGEIEKALRKLDPEVSPTIQGRDFVIATLAAPTVMKEPEKPAEAEATEGAEGAEGAEAAAADGDKPAAEGDKKEADEKKPTEDKK